MDIRDLLDQAYRKMDAQDFAGAVRDYRTAAMMAMPDATTLTNLTQASDYEQLAFLEQLRERYPDSELAWFMQARFYATIHSPNQAIELYAKMFDLFGATPKDRFSIHWDRLQAACRDIRVREKLIVEDVRIIWDMGEEYPPARKLRWLLLKIVVRELDDEGSIPIFEELLNDYRFPDSVRRLFEAKIAELVALSDAVDEI
jgi:hypothetical protein